MQASETPSVGEQVVSGTLWIGSWRWSARLVGFATTIILARLLVPEDFGIIATAGIVVGFFAIMTALGTDSYLIRHAGPDRVDYDTAWTLRVVVISAASVAIYLAAQPGADYFDDQRIVNVLRLMAVAGWLSAFSNIGLTMLRRELKFRKIALIGISSRLTASCTTIALAFWLRNYWAMVIGEMVFTLVSLVLSYALHDYRPRFTLERVRIQWAFCKWIVVQNLAGFLRTQGSSFVIVKFFGIELMGVFTMAGRVAAFPTQVLIRPVLSPVFSGLAKKQQEPEAFVTSILKVLGATAFLILPAATLVASLSEELVVFLLGDRWAVAIPLVAPLTFSALLGVLGGPAGTVLTLKGRVKLLAGLNWFAAISSVALLIFTAQWLDIDALVWVLAGWGFTFLILHYAIMSALIGLSVVKLLGSIYRPLVASLVMALVIFQVSTMIDSAWLVILLSAIFGGLSYFLVIALLWRVAGSPDSGEALLVRKIVKLIARQLKK